MDGSFFFVTSKLAWKDTIPHSNWLHLCLPDTEVLGNLSELCDRVLLCGLQDTLKVTNPLIHGSGHLLSLRGLLRTLIKGGMEGFADLFHSTAELISLEEEDEDHLVYTLKPVVGFGDLSLLHEHIPTASTRSNVPICPRLIMPVTKLICLFLFLHFSVCFVCTDIQQAALNCPPSPGPGTRSTPPSVMLCLMEKPL